MRNEDMSIKSRYSKTCMPVYWHRTVYDEKLHTDTDFILMDLNWHTAIELIYVHTGVVQILLDENRFLLNEKHFCIINAQLLHSIIPLDEHTYFDFVHFIPGAFQDWGIIPEKTLFRSAFQDSDLELLMDNLASAFEKSETDIDTKAEIIGIGLEILSLLYRRHQADTDEKIQFRQSLKSSSYIRCAISYIDEHFREPIHIEDLCRCTILSRHYLSHLFKKYTHMTIVEYINFIRCEYARTLLLSGMYSVSEAAENCGICNASYFDKVYRKYQGCLPSDEGKP